MENFIVSARKYRPATFDMVVGQDSITGTLKNAIKNGYLAQAYLFCGPRGVGKTTCARIFAKTINCSNLKENAEPCNECESCISFNTLRSLNIHELDAASNNKVEDIRNLTDMVRVPPQIGRYSIYIIDEVHMLSSQAFNAFLKTLEEPPSHAIFILATTEKHKIIPTILSRCQIFDFNRIRTEDIIGRLRFVAQKESVQCEEEALHVIAIKADGAMRDALSIFDQIISFSNGNVRYKDVIENLNLLDYEYFFRIVDASLQGDSSGSLLIFNEVLENGFDGHNFIAGLGTHLRDLLVSRDSVTLKLLDTAPAIREKYREQSSKCTSRFLFNSLEICNSCDLSYKISKNPRLLVEIALLKMAYKQEEVSGQQADEKKKLTPDLTDKRNDESALPPAVNEPALVPKAQATAKENSTVDPPRATARTVSVKDMISAGTYKKVDEAEKIVPELNEPSAPEPKRELSEEGVRELWSRYAASIKQESPRISGQLSAYMPLLAENNVITVRLSNAALREEFDRKCKMHLINLITETFDVQSVDIVSDVEETSAEDPVYYTDEQKYARLVSKNPSLKDLRRTFNLDFE
jgi:DNA polymerase III subunit gamma/tau